MTEVKNTAVEFGHNLSWAIIWFFLGVLIADMEITLSFNNDSVSSASQWVRGIQWTIGFACGWRACNYLRDAWFSRPWKKPIDKTEP